MNRNGTTVCLIALALAALAACSNNPAANDSKNPPAPLDKIQGKALINMGETTATDAALNAGGRSVYLVDGLHRYRLFFNTAIDVEPNKEYVAEGVNAQKVFDDLGDPDQGKNGYPLESSCQRAVKMAWSNLPFDVFDGKVSVLRARVKRYPARPVFLVTRLDPVADSAASKKDAADSQKDLPEVSVPAEKQRSFLIDGPTTLPAPLWEPAGGTVLCKLVIGSDGKISALETGMQLCEAVPWSQFRYQPPLQNGHPAKVKTEVEIRFEPRK